MSIRGIIEAALVSSGNSEESWAEYYDCPDGIEASFPYIEQAEARFIATFDPEHISLMEAVCEAADALPCCDLSRDYPRGSCSGCSQKPVCDTTASLTAHRKERGL